ncbi:hypothetical protein Tco_1343172 [Tanacetum coccineum]
MTINRLVLEWEERIKLHLEREMEFNRWKSKNFKGKHPTLVIVEGRIDDEGEVTGNTRDLGSFREETDEITDLHQILEEILLTGREDGVASIKRSRHDPSNGGVRDLVTASGRG